VLDLSRNKLAALPESMAAFSRLEQLNLSFNQIAFLPSAVSTLKCGVFFFLPASIIDVLFGRRLSVLDLSHNVLAEIPGEIGNMNLEHFSLSHKRLRRLPNTMGCVLFLAFLFL
jgi:Leucine-rich repeat (LRR) protein